jgi:thiol-disulfide isomerase/thioredoxin
MRTRPLLALALLPLASCGLYAPNSSVSILRPYQLAAVRSDPQRTWVVEAYASWCGHCQAFVPQLEGLASKLSAWGDRMAVGAIDCAVDISACVELGVTGYPTLFVWGRGVAMPGQSADVASAGPDGAEASAEERAADGAPARLRREGSLFNSIFRSVEGSTERNLPHSSTEQTLGFH